MAEERRCCHDFCWVEFYNVYDMLFRFLFPLITLDLIMLMGKLRELSSSPFEFIVGDSVNSPQFSGFLSIDTALWGAFRTNDLLSLRFLVVIVLVFWKGIVSISLVFLIGAYYLPSSLFCDLVSFR